MTNTYDHDSGREDYYDGRYHTHYDGEDTTDAEDQGMKATDIDIRQIDPDQRIIKIE